MPPPVSEIVAAQMFGMDIGNQPHTMTVRLDQPPYRDIFFKREDSSLYWFELVTWPGHLTITGDMGTLTFRRVTDMIDFFGDSTSRINPGYWAEKIQSLHDPLDCRVYDPDKFVQRVCEDFAAYADEHGWVLTRTQELWAALQEFVLNDAEDERAAVAAASRFSFPEDTWHPQHKLEFAFYDVWDWDLRVWDQRYLWLCWAVLWGVNRYLGREVQLPSEILQPQPKAPTATSSVRPAIQTQIARPDFL
jgi:hypothetical protein